MATELVNPLCPNDAYLRQIFDSGYVPMTHICVKDESATFNGPSVARSTHKGCEHFRTSLVVLRLHFGWFTVSPGHTYSRQTHIVRTTTELVKSATLMWSAQIRSSGVQWGGARAVWGVLVIAVCACFHTFVCGRGWMCVYMCV